MSFAIGIGNWWGNKALAEANQAFEFTVDTTQAGTSTADQFTIPITSATPYNISTSDGHSITGATGATTLTFSAPGTYTVKITDSCEGWKFNNGGDRRKLMTIENWGVFTFTTNNAFHGCSNLVANYSDTPTIATTNLQATFSSCSNFNGYVNDWDISGVTNIATMFFACGSFNQDLGNWDVSSVTTMGYMFNDATNYTGIGLENWNAPLNTSLEFTFRRTKFNADISGWDVSNVTSFYLAFSDTPFNQDISGWTIKSSGNVNMRGMFSGATLFNQPIGSWNTSAVGNMLGMFSGATSFNQPLNTWNTITVTDTQQMFQNATSFNQDISSWNVSNVLRADRMFSGATSFNQDLPNWTWTNLQFQGLDYMFERAYAFNGDLSNWTFPNVTRLASTFDGVSGIMAFNNSSIANWDVSNITLLANTFRNCRNMNIDLSSWSNAPLTNLNQTFMDARVFDFSYITNWNIVGVSTFANFMLYDPDLPTATYDAILVSWEAKLQVAYPGGTGYTLTPSISFNGSQYTLGSAAEAARTSLISTYGWTITDGGGISLPFIFTVENTFNSNPLSFTIPADTATYTYNYNVSTSDGQNFTNQTGPLALTFAGVGPYDITVSGTYPSMRFGTNPGNGNKIVDIKQFGSNTWQDFEDMFAYSLLSVVTATDTPNLSAVTSLKNCFKNATSYNDPKLNNWDVSTITTFETFLWNAGPVIYGSFNQDLSSWDVSNANTFYYMFDGCPMNQSFAAWNVTSLGTTNPTTAGLEFISPDTSQTPKMSTANYDATLISWAGQAVQSGVTINFRAAQYTLGGVAEAARNTLINTYGWTIVDAGGI